MILYVDANAQSQGNGTKEAPFKTIQQAADIAAPGDEVLVYPGVYRENVDPQNPGMEEARIVYKSVEPYKAVIKGSEVISDWVPMGNGVYKTSVPDKLFGAYNPFTTLISGDWFMAFLKAHTGDVYLNGKSLYEVTELDKVYEPEKNTICWDPDFSVYTWYTQRDDANDATIIYANFHEFDPNRELVEISVRANCFYPQKEGVSFITFSGFTVTQAATQWAPPTAYQEGMIGPHWSKGWIIEDCDISESKCSGISLGKYRQNGNDNKWLHYKYKNGAQTQRECICQAQREGWTKDRIGHHTIRRCKIHDCGQTGIVGHLGGVFSVIEDNHIYRINNKQNIAGAEIGGIKMHAAIDCVFRGNHIHHCTRGLWLDWQAQGTRVTRNFFHHNTVPFVNEDAEASMAMFDSVGEDIFIEVSHGPTLLDNNILLSARAVKIPAQGIAMVHNLIAGAFTTVGTGTDNGMKHTPRYTPYHVPHQTEIAGFMTFLHGDDRFYNNVFIQQQVHPFLKKLEKWIGDDLPWDDGRVAAGTDCFDDGYETYEEWAKDFEGYCGMGAPGIERYYKKLPVWTGGNVFLNGARPWRKEKDFIEIKDKHVDINAIEKDGAWFMETNLYEILPKNTCRMIDTETLGMAFEPEQKYEDPDGLPITFDTDYNGVTRPENPTAGPIEVYHN